MIQQSRVFFNDFITYIYIMGGEKKNSNLLDEEIDIWYKINNVIFEKNQLFGDFTITLINLINETYLGSDVIDDEDKMFSHFSWCYTKTIENFQKENIMFKSKGSLHDYFWEFTYLMFYTNSTEKSMDIIYQFYNKIFNFMQLKSNGEKETYKFLYKLFDMNLIF